MTDLSDFGAERVAPLVERRVCKQSPHTGKLCGFVGRDTRRDRVVYATRRAPFHFYRKGSGYAISDTIINSLDQSNVSRILVYEPVDEGGDVYEFPLRVYENGKPVPTSDLYDEDDPQTYVPVSEAMNNWLGLSPYLFVRPFEDAMKRIEWRGFDPDHPARD